MAVRAPRHLKAPTRKWFEGVVAGFELDEHHVKLLQLAGEAWDRGQQAREALQQAGSLVYEDRYGCPHPRPELNVERDSRLSFARMLRELGLDVAPPVEAPRAYPLPANGGRKAG